MFAAVVAVAEGRIEPVEERLVPGDGRRGAPTKRAMSRADEPARRRRGARGGLGPYPLIGRQSTAAGADARAVAARDRCREVIRWSRSCSWPQPRAVPRASSRWSPRRRPRSRRVAGGTAGRELGTSSAGIVDAVRAALRGSAATASSCCSTLGAPRSRSRWPSRISRRDDRLRVRVSDGPLVEGAGRAAVEAAGGAPPGARYCAVGDAGTGRPRRCRRTGRLRRAGADGGERRAPRRLASAGRRAVADERERLTDLDAAIGDGDHGINLDRGFRELDPAARRGVLPRRTHRRLSWGAAGRTLTSTVGRGERRPLRQGLPAGWRCARADGACGVGRRPARPGASPWRPAWGPRSRRSRPWVARGPARRRCSTRSCRRSRVRGGRRRWRPARSRGAIACGRRRGGRGLRTFPLLATKGRASYLGDGRSATSTPGRLDRPPRAGPRRRGGGRRRGPGGLAEPGHDPDAVPDASHQAPDVTLPQRCSAGALRRPRPDGRVARGRGRDITGRSTRADRLCPPGGPGPGARSPDPGRSARSRRRRVAHFLPSRGREHAIRCFHGRDLRDDDPDPPRRRRGRRRSPGEDEGECNAGWIVITMAWGLAVFAGVVVAGRSAAPT